MIENFLHPNDRPRYSSNLNGRTVLIGLAILGTILSVPVTMQLINVPQVHAVTDQPPVEVCGTWTSGPSGVQVGLGGYDPDGVVVSATVNWGDGTVETSTDWNYCSAAMTQNYVAPSQFGHVSTHHYATTGTFTITQTLTDNSGSTLTEHQSFLVVSTDPASPGPMGGCCQRPA